MDDKTNPKTQPDDTQKAYFIPEVEHTLATRPTELHYSRPRYRKPETLLAAQARGMARDERDMRKNYGRCLR